MTRFPTSPPPPLLSPPTPARPVPYSPEPAPPAPSPTPPVPSRPAPVPLRPPCSVPEFTPVRAGRGRYALRRALRGRRRAVAAGLAMVAAALAAAPARGGDEAPGNSRESSARSTAQAPSRSNAIQAPVTVSAPVRIPDAETVRLLEPGDRIDVIASGSGNSTRYRSSSESTSAHFVARNVRVAEVPRPGDTVAGEGALVVLEVSRRVASELAAAAATSRLAVTLC
ncbi:RcpC/CpaB family pilus assembly protein [Streptomyces sp. ODS28]|uniref:RcpC/CpaB family pilus assembly protein n=1 Tax=Streptomyces sp. ODS28 TaxID=3136688 RepID=UPI0031E9716C